MSSLREPSSAEERANDRVIDMASARSGRAGAPAALRAKLWDVPTRIGHWALVGLVGFAWWSAENGHMEWHRLSGYAVIGLLVFRIFWGFVGSSSARFASFVRGPAKTWAYVRSLPDRNHVAAPGHNPLGAWSVIALLATLVTQVVTGLFSVDVDGIESGPLSDRVDFDTGRRLAQIHHWSFWALEALVLLHLAAIVFYFLFKRLDLVGPMITGRGRYDRDPGVAFAPYWRLALIVVVAASAAWWASKGFRV